MFSTDGTSQVPVTFVPASHAWPMYWGYVAIAIATVLFGSYLIPVKKLETGDGVFFQWISCIGIFLTGFVLNGIRLFPEFFPLAMLGGFLWCTGNIICVPIIKTVGLSQGMLIWASLNMLSGWAVSRFGLLGLKSDIPPHVELNYVGVFLCLVSTVTYMFIKTSNAPSASTGDREAPLISADVPLSSPTANSPVSAAGATTAGDGVGDAVTKTSLPVNDHPVFYERMSRTARRVFGTVMAVAAGMVFGLHFSPVIYVQQHPDKFPTDSSNGMDYVFAHFTGILITSTVYMLIYSAAMKNKPRIYPQVILPGFVAGVTWGVADMGWFVANDTLSQPVSFPIITSLPALIGAFWGIVLFGEIKGRRNFVILLLAVCFALAGSTLTGLSKWDNSAASQNTTTTSVTTTSSNSNAVTNLVTSI